ncbi:BglG family transcription antiterminator [Gemella sp. zg-1178]|uniref:BglG family transcription antiterminator n=1 Tax=Gemella sp. zg-1178 TaxID=2840372 RepID=UPI001C04D0B1|nr:BglG family transcription antiterminator [Gemella sp. zg-1178]MBU0278445.1 BglG family transcription antiterminator [Gemella sp. zg-1178]
MQIPIIDNKDLKIINLLAEERFIPINKLSQELSVSDRSIRNYIKRINEELVNIISIEAHRTKGVYLNIYDKTLFNKFLKENNQKNLALNSREDRIKYIIDYFVELDGIATLDELAYQINIGKTTLIGDMKEVDKILKKFSCKIKSKKNIGSYLDYNEIDIRLLILNYCCENYTIEMINNKYLKLETHIIKSLKTDIYNFLTENNYNTTKLILDEIIKHILIMLYRVKKGYIINHIEKKHSVITNHSYLRKYTDSVGELIEKYFDIKVNENGRIYLSIPFLTRNAAVSEIYDEENIDNFVIRIMDKIWLKINQDIGFVINDKKLLKNLALHLNYSINRIIFNVQINNTSTYDIKKKYKFAYRLAELSSKIIEDELGVNVSESETALIAIHFGALLENNKAKVSKLKNFALVCENGLGTSMLLKARLKRMLSSDSKIDVFSIYEFAKIDHSEYQIVFTTISPNTKVFQSISLPIIKIDTLFNENEILNLIENTLYINNFNDNEDNNSFILKFIQDNHIHFYKSSDYKEILVDMIDSLIDSNKVNEKFKKYIIDREEVNPTIFDNGIMLPHYTSELIQEPVIAIGVLKEECYHCNKIVKFIILTAYPKEEMIDPDLIIKIYDDIMNIGQDVELMNSLINTNSSAEFKQIIRSL